MAAQGQGCFLVAENLVPISSWVTLGKSVEGMRVGLNVWAPACFPSNAGDSGLGPLPHLLSGPEPSVHTGHLSQALHLRLSSVGRWALDLAGTLVIRATDTDGHDGDGDDGNGIKMTVKVVTERQQLEFVGHGLEPGCGPAPLCRGGGGPRGHTESWRVRARTGWGSCWGGASAPTLWTPFWGSFLSPGGWRDWDVSSAEVMGTFCDDTFRLSS